MSVHDRVVSCMLVEVVDKGYCTCWKIQALQESPQGQLDYVTSGGSYTSSKGCRGSLAGMRRELPLLLAQPKVLLIQSYQEGFTSTTS